MDTMTLPLRTTYRDAANAAWDLAERSGGPEALIGEIEGLEKVYRSAPALEERRAAWAALSGIAEAGGVPTRPVNDCAAGAWRARSELKWGFRARAVAAARVNDLVLWCRGGWSWTGGTITHVEGWRPLKMAAAVAAFVECARHTNNMAWFLAVEEEAFSIVSSIEEAS